jgi:hypothetical protein
MFKPKNKFESRIPPLRPIDKNRAINLVKSKLDNHIAIKPSSGHEKLKDYRFETDE